MRGDKGTVWVLLILASGCLSCEEPPERAMAPTAPASVQPDRTSGAARNNPVPQTPAEAQTAENVAEPPERVAAQHILIAYRGAKNAPSGTRRSKDEAMALAREVRAKATAGAPFTDLVSEFSEDPASKQRLGSVGVFTRDKMVKPFSDAAFGLRVNEVSEIVETEFGFHLIKRNQ